MKKQLNKAQKPVTKIIIKSREEINMIRIANRIVAEVLLTLKETIKQGITTLDLDIIAEEMIVKAGGKPAFKGYRKYPATLCVSLNNEVVHGIPSKERILQRGDIVSMDVGVIYNNYVGDAALSTFVEGSSDPLANKLMEITEKSLYDGIKECLSRARLQNISSAIQATAENAGFSVVRNFVGHGVGRYLHEPPAIPNYGKRGQGPMLMPGMVLAIEPMINAGTHEVDVLSDGWTAVTKDGSLSAHFEHSVVVTENEPEILSII